MTQSPKINSILFAPAGLASSAATTGQNYQEH
jgi:hypothetical protein